MEVPQAGDAPVSEVGCAAGCSETGRCQFQFWAYLIDYFYKSLRPGGLLKTQYSEYSLTMNFLAADQTPPFEPQIYFVYVFSPPFKICT